jgi:hypothetical protein
MNSLKKSLRTGSFAVILAAGAMAAVISVASAEVVCNRDGECWHTAQKYAVTIYPPEIGVQIYDNDWRKSHETDTKYKWMKDRDDDHGYYRNGEWHAVQRQ